MHLCICIIHCLITLPALALCTNVVRTYVRTYIRTYVRTYVAANRARALESMGGAGRGFSFEFCKQEAQGTVSQWQR